MTKEIVKAIAKEIQTFLEADNATVLIDTQTAPYNIESHMIPVIIITIVNADIATPFIGGSKIVRYELHIRCYDYEFNQGLSPDEDYALSSLTRIESIENHFIHKDWLTQEIKDCVTNYGISPLVEENSPARAEHDNGRILFGFAIKLMVTAVTNVTNWDAPKAHVAGGTILPKTGWPR